MYYGLLVDDSPREIQLDLQDSLRRFFFWFWVIFMAFNAWMVSRGQWLVQSNSTSLAATTRSNASLPWTRGVSCSARAR